MPEKPARKKVVITVPLSRAPALKPDEEISLRHLRKHLGAFDKFLILPESSQINLPDFQLAKFGEVCFGSVGAYNRLMLSRAFYERFSDYEYMLHYHLDSLVFSDQLIEWCNAGFDYIAPPWIESKEAPWATTPRVGNGGFSLRRIDAFLDVLDSNRLATDPEQQWAGYRKVAPLWRRMILWPRRYVRRHFRFNGVQTQIRKYLEEGNNEDMFWSYEAENFSPGFKLASYAVGRRFAFEIQPRLMYEQNDRRLPFGAHAFGRYDRGFWEPFLLR